jgi:hypothetical protein
MFWVAVAGFFALIVLPVGVAAFEGARTNGGPRDLGFWTFARQLAGTCHVPWGRFGSPVVRFELNYAEGRARAVRMFQRRGWVVEVRAYQRVPFGFSARLCWPPAPPARFRAPGLATVELEMSDEVSVIGASVETNDERLLRWLLRHVETRRALDALPTEADAESIEVVLLGSVVVMRARMGRSVAAGEALESVGPALVGALRRLSDDLGELGFALDDAGEPLHLKSLCSACGARLGGDPWRCPGCGTESHRGCREMAGGCINGRCERAPDAATGAIT